MSKLIIPTQNFFEEKAKGFSQTALGEKLQRKYTPKPFEERWKVLYFSAWIGSFFCNIVAIITGSTFVFVYALGLVAKLPNPEFFAFIIAFMSLIGLEILKQITVPTLFQDFNQYGFKKSYIGRIAFILGIFGISFVFNYFGGFDFIANVTAPPLYQTPKQKDVEKVRNEYNALIKQAGENAEKYRLSKLWKGKLSDNHAGVYQKLLGKKQNFSEKMIAKIDSVESWNDSEIREAKQDYKSATSDHKDKLQNRGKGLAWFSVGCEFLMILCFWYREFYEWETAKQYGQVKNFTPSQDTDTEEGDTGGSVPPTQSRKQQKNTAQPDTGKGIVSTIKYNYTTKATQGASDTDTDLIFLDKYTIEHNGKRYKLSDVNRFVKTYSDRYTESIQRNDTATAQGRKTQLDYWQGRKIELLEKIKRAEA
ncbi:MAG: hypothetical protein ACKVTZ_04275 [Bacteroidia bacterium]